MNMKSLIIKKFVQIKNYSLMAFVQSFQKIVIKLIFVQRGYPVEL